MPAAINLAGETCSFERWEERGQPGGHSSDLEDVLIGVITGLAGWLAGCLSLFVLHSAYLDE